MDESQKSRLIQKSSDFKFIDEQHLISWYGLEYSVINYEKCQILQNLRVQGDMGLIPDRLNSIESCPVLIGFDVKNNSMKIQDIMNIGFKGELTLATQVYFILGQVENNQDSNQRYEGKQVQILVYDENRRLLLQTIKIK
ncbi:hypothetical protein OXYTRIMIC_789 [Oxytricha trifallax]|uniref:Uncharacterized protein n=1 Tax=Oxytricha trifallax TaxID=1172189 RepID=A0A073I114_9SPIT|nr:hypothetical protein OXYTRIMIC_789 [Oxytricha trifallax]